MHGTGAEWSSALVGQQCGACKITRLTCSQLKNLPWPNCSWNTYGVKDDVDAICATPEADQEVRACWVCCGDRHACWACWAGYAHSCMLACNARQGQCRAKRHAGHAVVEHKQTRPGGQQALSRFIAAACCAHPLQVCATCAPGRDWPKCKDPLSTLVQLCDGEHGSCQHSMHCSCAVVH